MSYEPGQHFTQQEIDIIHVVSKICSGLSFAGSLVICLLFWFFKQTRSFKSELVVWYCLFNSMYLLSFFFPYDPVNEMTWCAIQSFTMTCFEIASMLWSSIIGYTAFISVIRKDHIEKNHGMYRISYLLLVIIVSAGLASMYVIFNFLSFRILFTDTYGSSGGWCWIDIYEDQRAIVYKLVLFYLCIQWFFLILNLFFIYKVIHILKENITNKNKYLMKTYSVMKWYPIIQIVCSLPATINRIYDIIVKETNFSLMITQTVFDCIGGCFITTVFLFSPEIKNSLRVCWIKFLSKSGRNRKTVESSLIAKKEWAPSATSDFTICSDGETSNINVSKNNFSV